MAYNCPESLGIRASGHLDKVVRFITLNILHNNTLLVDGTAAFDEILRCIDAAHTSILINMFIWRDDNIGNRLAHAILRAANRGVRITISIDRVGMILELCEENERSFFHGTPCTFERFKIGLLRWGYPSNRPKVASSYICSGLLKQLLSHPNIVIDRDRKKNDHSKFYVIDEHILIFGSINVEDKECGMDCAGRVYQDYMLKLEGEEHIRVFLEKLEENQNISDVYYFRMNNKHIYPPVFEMNECFLSIINGAQKELVIVMAYFAPVKAIIRAIVSAWRRGVHIKILIPGNANFQNDSNRKTMRLLMKYCQNEIEVRLSSKMIHTKLIFNENYVMFGSCNITNRSFSQLGEVDIELKNEDTPLINQFKESVAENWYLSHPVDDYRQIRYSPAKAWIESRLN